MAQMLAPYNNSMRLGQGFNSYTQQICLDKAVLPDTEYNRALVAARAERKTIKLSDGSSKTIAGQLTKSSDAPKSPELKSLNGSVGDESEDAKDPDIVESKVSLAERRPKQTENKSEPAKAIQVLPWVKPQIVTYSSRFVDKLSDVTDAMNISGSLSIKTATIGGKANGSYVDSDKFKSSDINFHLQVKVTNQIHDAQNYSIFNKIDNVEPSALPEIYGDTFISGWEEGGELNAIISIKVMNKAKIFEIKAGLEAEMNTPSVSGEIKGDFEMAKNNSNSETETTIAVNWSGGGSIKDPSDDWDINTLKKAAAAFPDLVAITPQRTYAILTKYTALASFHEQNQKFSPLDYENAGIYTGALLDQYMDYKSLWKQISQATYDLEGNRATIEMAQPTEDIYDLAEITSLPANEADVKFAKMITDGRATAKTANDSSSADEKQLELTRVQTPPAKSDAGTVTTQFRVFQPTFAGLIAARKICRFEMSKIVNEVDLVAKNPKLSSDPERDAYFLNPLVFKQLLPIVRSLSPENAVLGVKDPGATIILGYSNPPVEDRSQPPVYKLETAIGSYSISLQQTIQAVNHKARNYRLHGCVGAIKDTHSQAEVFNDLRELDSTYRPTKISAWMVEGLLKGIGVKYSSGKMFTNGECTGTATHWLDLADDGSEIIVEVIITEAIYETKSPVISALRVATSACNTLDTSKDMEQSLAGKADTKEKGVSKPAEETKTSSPTETTGSAAVSNTSTSAESMKSEELRKTQVPKKVKMHTWVRPEDGQWSLRGFFGITFKSRLVTLGVVWGKDSFVPIPAARISTPLCKNFLGICPALQDSIKRIKLLKNGRVIADNNFMGTSVTTTKMVETTTTQDKDVLKHFNALDEIDITWKIKVLAFASKDNMLTGIRVIYTNGEQVDHGLFAVADEKWRCEVNSDLVCVKITAGAMDDVASAYVDTLEFVQADSEGQLPTWPLYLSTLRYLGESEARVSTQISEVIEQAPKIGNSRWSARGFYGEHNGKNVTRLGVVWGRG